MTSARLLVGIQKLTRLEPIWHVQTTADLLPCYYTTPVGLNPRLADANTVTTELVLAY